MREYSDEIEAAHYLDMAIEDFRALVAQGGGPVRTDVGNQPRCYQRRDLHVFKAAMLGQSGL